MKITVRLFAGMREAVGRSPIVFDVPEGTTARQMLGRLVDGYPEAAKFHDAVAFAINRDYADGDRVLLEGDELAVIPPVSGGRDLCEITEAPLSLEALIQHVRQDSSGAVASFVGVVRATSRGRTVRHLEYEAYPEMAVAKMRQIVDEIRARWPVDRIALVHRTGRLEIGEASVAIVVSSPHRREALEACAHAIERLKAMVPIWKKEVWTDGAEWIGSATDEYRELPAEKREPDEGRGAATGEPSVTV